MSLLRGLLAASFGIVLAAGLPPPALAQPLTVAAAADLQVALPPLIAVFEQEAGRAVRVTYGSSGNFFAQIQNGAPFDVFLSADVEYPRRLERAGLTEPGTLVAYARGRLVLWARHDSRLDLSGGLHALAASPVRRIAIANPDHAPYGQAAVAALRAAGLFDRLRTRLVFGENISQAAQFAQSGNADAGILALSLALGPALRSAGRHVEIPSSLHPPIEQGAVVIGTARQKAAAKQFLAFLQRADTVAYLKSRGFEVPER